MIMAKEIRYKCEECRRILGLRIQHRCNGVLQNLGKWEKVTIGLPSLGKLGAANGLFSRNYSGHNKARNDV